MLQQQIAQRVVLSLMLLGTAIMLSFTAPATEAHTLTKASLTVKSPQNQNIPLAENPSPLVCSTCDLPSANPTFTLTVLAAFFSLVVMGFFIYGGELLVNTKVG